MKKQAILIMAHGSLNILNKLLELLDSKYFDIYIHIDTKSTIEEKDIYECIYSKLYVYKRYDVKWADYSMIETELFLFEEAYNNNYEYYHLISGVDLPLKSNKYIYELFYNNYPKEFIHYENLNVSEHKLNWIKYYYIMDYVKENPKYRDSNMACMYKQKKDGIDRLKGDKKELKTGANWVSITHELVGYILSEKEYIRDRFPFTRSSDEFFIQTLAYNSKFKDNLYYDKFDDNYSSCLRAIDWSRGSPYTWRTSDFEDLIKSDKIFARKFSEDVDSEIIDKIFNYVKELNKNEE